MANKEQPKDNERHVVAYVEWIDSSGSTGGWHDLETSLKDNDFGRTLQAAGLVLRHDDEGIILGVAYGPHWDDTPDAAGVLAIPKRQINSLKLWDPDKVGDGK